MRAIPPASALVQYTRHCRVCTTRLASWDSLPDCSSDKPRLFVQLLWRMLSACRVHNHVNVCLRLNYTHFHKFNFRARRGHRQTILTEPLDVEVDSLADQLQRFIPRLTHGY